MSEPVMCPDNCEHLVPTEREQDHEPVKRKHYCTKYDRVVEHGIYHPKLVRRPECVRDLEAVKVCTNPLCKESVQLREMIDSISHQFSEEKRIKGELDAEEDRKKNFMRKRRNLRKAKRQKWKK